MCGIHGIISKSISKNEVLERLQRMGTIQRHRGPDDRREEVYSFTGGCVGLGFVRLSILDLETGMQPIVCPNDQTAIICNGQIYNYLELKSLISSEDFITRGDVEVALHLYRKRGLAFFHLLNGMYAGAIFDPQNRKLLLFRDRFGIKPLYYTEHNGNFLFASEIKPMLEGNGISPRLNNKRLGAFFSYRYLPGGETMFAGIKRVPSGSYLDYDLESGKYQVIRYWEYRLDRENRSISLEDAEEKFFSIFSDAVRIRLRSDVEVGTFLSGGIDSSAVSSLAVRHNPDIRLFTIAFAEPEHNELSSVDSFIKRQKGFSRAKHYSCLCGRETLNLLPRIIRSLEEPISLGTIFPTNQVCQLAGEYVKVVLTGEGADEIFGGYRKFLLEMAAERYPHLSGKQQKVLDDAYPELDHYLRIRHSDPVRRYIQSELLFTNEALKTLLGVQFTNDDITPPDALPSLTGAEHPLNAALAMESRFRLPEYVILRLDKLSMRHSLETRTPFLDYRLAEFAATLPVEFKVGVESGQEKLICRHSFFHKGILDKETAFRKKQPFTAPLAHWFSQSPKKLPDFLQEVLLGDMIKKQGILDPEMVKGMINKVSAKGVGPATLVSEADRVFAVCIFSLWYHEFFQS